MQQGGGGKEEDSGDRNNKAPESRRKKATEDLPVRNSNNGARGKYHLGGKVQEENADKSAEWSGKETEGLATEE